MLFDRDRDCRDLFMIIYMTMLFIYSFIPKNAQGGIGLWEPHPGSDIDAPPVLHRLARLLRQNPAVITLQRRTFLRMFGT